MSWLLYRWGVAAFRLFIHLAAWVHPKAKAMVEGRRGWRQKLQARPQAERPIWLHAASLGEMEQGLPVAELLHRRYPDRPLVISFFSPSGYQNFATPEWVDEVIYLPLESPRNARDFVKLLQPSLAVFIKYDLWAYYLRALQKAQIPIVVVPALFPAKLWFFGFPARRLFVPLLQKIDLILVQDEASRQNLAHWSIEAQYCGDTRFDRVKRLSESPWQEARLPPFLAGKFCVVAGSSWPPEEKILAAALQENPDFKLVLAPHDVQPKNIERLSKDFAQYGLSRYSEAHWPAEHRVLLIDNIGLLSKLYRYANLAFVGGGLGQNVHSTVEPAVYGIPLCFGPRHQRFIEPGEMLRAGHAREVHQAKDFIAFLKALLPRDTEYQALVQIAKDYVDKKTGAIAKVEEALADLKL